MRPKHALAPVVPVLLALVLLPWGSSPASAHAHLKVAEPPVDGTVPTAPTTATITFTKGVEPHLSGIEVTNAGSVRVDQNDAHLVGSDDEHLAVDLKPLTPGSYKMRWHATAVDTHKTDGTFHFIVGQPATGR